MEHIDEPKGLWVVNDLRRAFPKCEVRWTVTTEVGREVAKGTASIDLPADGRVRVGDFKFDLRPEERYRVALELRASDGRVLARNLYEDPFHHPGLLEGYPERVDHELGMRLWNA